jgi:hypothetical protein
MTRSRRTKVRRLFFNHARCLSIGLNYHSRLKPTIPQLDQCSIGNGKSRSRILWHIMIHVMNHGTQHRSEAAAILTSFNQSPGDLDFTMYLNTLK